MCQLKMITPKVIKALPKAGQKLNQLLPQPMKIALINSVLNKVFAKDCALGALDFLTGKKVLIEVTDFAFSFIVELQAQQLKVSALSAVNAGGAESLGSAVNVSGGPRAADTKSAAQKQQADLTVKASSVDFFLLCSSQADPDTLFFQRRLSMLGDTELGLYLKNYLDSFDSQNLLPAKVWQLQQYLALQLTPEPQAAKSGGGR
ncbi:SCP2 domain-containing protein [Rheinheimera sp. 4Y26]|uniref:ubiquinone anaerobic biosynthesis accessory factor UbiT n=1 Tax=Rheinheimera sp. 4Y26 TaxID=2977811 RepID=UPI0021B0D943|nr:SCP2 sterol-binding domain-containing protein [Rheinheimera sp. 4Y26]MCT6701207.1 SCP2 sterol-binding domain-containing protein [Rheinheimera sp. 4Y26]